MNLKKEIKKRLSKVPGVEDVSIEKVYIVRIKAARQFAGEIYSEEKEILRDHPRAKVDFNIEYQYINWTHLDKPSSATK